MWSDYALPIVRHFEGCAKRLKSGMIAPYLDRLPKKPLWTRGYGRTYGITADSSEISLQEAEKELSIGLASYAQAVLKLSPCLALHPHKLAAVVSWAWNCGIGAYKVSRLRRSINNGDWKEAAENIRTPRTSGGREVRGLALRREAERSLFLSD
jgi:lysozyme